MRKRITALEEQAERKEQLAVFFDWMSQFKVMLVREVGPKVSARNIMTKKNKQVKVSDFSELRTYYEGYPLVKQIVDDILWNDTSNYSH